MNVPKTMVGTAVCDDPHHCTFSDCPTAFCDRAGRPDGWIPAGHRPNGHERRVLCWVVWPGPGFPEPIVGWWKHGPGCFAVEGVENADHLVTHWKEIGEPAL